MEPSDPTEDAGEFGGFNNDIDENPFSAFFIKRMIRFCKVHAKLLQKLLYRRSETIFTNFDLLWRRHHVTHAEITTINIVDG